MASPFARATNPKRLRYHPHASGECEIMACHETANQCFNLSFPAPLHVCGYHAPMIASGMPVVGFAESPRSEEG